MEQQQRQLLVKALNRAGQDATSVENPACPGTPDIQFINGWIECKYLEDWPAHPETTVRIEHFTSQQRCWLLRRWVACKKLGTEHGVGWLILYVAKTKEHLLFDGETAAYRVAKDGVNRAKLYELAILKTVKIQDVINYVKCVS